MRQFKFRIWHKNELRWLDPWAEEDPILSLKDFGQGCTVYLYDREDSEHTSSFLYSNPMSRSWYFLKYLS